MSVTPPRLLWAHGGCLLDSTGGAARSALQMLHALHDLGWPVRILGSTASENGVDALAGRSVREVAPWLIEVVDGRLTHRLIQARAARVHDLSARELSHLWYEFEAALDEFRPEIYFHYGGQMHDMAMAAEARRRGIRVVAYLVSGNYEGRRWCRDVDLILTDSQATAARYQGLGKPIVAVGTFIDPTTCVAAERKPRHVLFVNATLAKGAGLVAQLALMLGKTRPEIIFEVAEGGGNWEKVLRLVSRALGEERESLPNVVVTPAVADMRPLYARARMLLAPSLCWESGARVLAEAMHNGIPAIASDSGGNAEMVGAGGAVFRLPAALHEPPYVRLPAPEILAPLVEQILAWFDDEAAYQAVTAAALATAHERHDLKRNTARLVSALCRL
ncbi:MAG: glycosyltransferase family 4 protein [Rhodocyclaceae bacterium]|nr:glycosyltransferase family 4 protein [Rhodocyclaceae bacterium]